MPTSVVHFIIEAIATETGGGCNSGSIADEIKTDDFCVFWYAMLGMYLKWLAARETENDLSQIAVIRAIITLHFLLCRQCQQKTHSL